MLKKHLILIGIIISLILLYIATLHYPGGSQADKNSIGYDWANNYLSNLFGPKAVNGAENTARTWADFGMLFFCGSVGLFFVDFSTKIPIKSASNIIRYFGIAAMMAAFLAVTPLHDLAVTISCISALIAIFYATVFILKSKLLWFKLLCIVYLLSLYVGMYSYYTRSFLQLLPILQKTSLGISVIWTLGLYYFTKRGDFKAKEKISVDANLG
ncbi:MAG: hypothetical protein JST50_14735 [Bacteroidetes bacterium]|jgi:hypothetical protein|nr:hypothetical protein [Bacteroidota bacterium]